jgi:hypothetical protein
MRAGLDARPSPTLHRGAEAKALAVGDFRRMVRRSTAFTMVGSVRASGRVAAVLPLSSPWIRGREGAQRQGGARSEGRSFPASDLSPRPASWSVPASIALRARVAFAEFDG